jgi:hypothetical protein
MFNLILIYIIFFIALFGGLLHTFGIPTLYTLISEFSIFLLLLFSFVRRSGRAFNVQIFWFIFVIYLLITPLSAMLNDTPLLRSLDSYRFLFRFYFFYLALTLIEPEEHFFKKCNIIIIAFLILQFPFIINSFLEHGISERTMGAYAVHAGSMGTILPISVIFYLSSFYFIYKQKISYIIFGAAFVVFSIISAKRAVLFLYPLQFIMIYYLIYSKATQAHFAKRTLVFATAIALTLFISGTILYLNKTLNPDRTVGGEIDVGYALSVAEQYNRGVTSDGYTYGRIATTERVFGILYESGIANIILGMGPGSTTPSIFDNKKDRQLFEKRYDDFKINYGITAMTRIALEFGIIGVVAYSWMLITLTLRSWKLYTRENDPYWKAFAGGSFGFSISMLFFFFCYSHNAFWGNTMPALYFYAMAVVYVRYQYRPLSQKDHHIANVDKVVTSSGDKASPHFYRN